MTQNTRYAYTVIVSQHGADYAEQAADIAAQTRAWLQKQPADTHIVRQTVFFRDAEQLNAVAGEFRRQYQAALERNLPQTAFVSQPPADGKLLAVEITAVSGAQVAQENDGLTLVRHDGITFVHTHGDALQGRAALGENAFADTLDVLNENKRLLAQGGAGLAQVFRTWFYMGSIVAPDSRSADGIQRYKELNRARTVAFDGVRFLRDTLQKQPAFDVYPASTGIGMGGEDVALSCSALLTERKDVFTLPLENPRQTPAFDYARHYSPETPKFARAMAVDRRNPAEYRHADKRGKFRQRRFCRIWCEADRFGGGARLCETRGGLRNRAPRVRETAARRAGGVHGGRCLPRRFAGGIGSRCPYPPPINGQKHSG